MLLIPDPKNLICGRYYSMRFGICFLTEDYQIIHAAEVCRDYLHEIISTFINGNKRHRLDFHSYYPENGEPSLCMSQLKLLVQLDPAFCTALGAKRGIHLLNSIERKAGMSCTKATEVIIGDSSCGKTGIVVEGCGDYMQNPHLLSLLTLIIRFYATHHDFPECDSFDEFMETFNKSSYAIKLSLDGRLISSCFLIEKVLINRDKIFAGKSIYDLFPKVESTIKDEHSVIRTFHEAGGIKALCCAKTLNADVNKKVLSLLAASKDKVVACS